MDALRFESAVLCSDIHLSTHSDKISTAFIHWLKESCLTRIKSKPEWLLILGDLFDAWIGDDILETANPPEYLGRLVSILKEISQSGIKVGIMHGNRDFLIGEDFCKKTHTKLLPQEIILSHSQSKSNYLLMHGDQLCIDDKEHQEFRKTVLSAHWKDIFLKKDISNRLLIASQMRKESNYAKSRKRQEIMDINISEVEKQLNYSNASIIIHGHTHRPGSYELPSGKKRIVLPDWRIFKDKLSGGGLLLKSSGIHQLSL